MGKDKLKSINIKFFLIPFLIISIGFATLTYFTVMNRVNEHYQTLEKMTMNMADGYSQRIVHSEDAHDIITELLDEKLLVASEAIMLIENKEDNDILRDIAQRFNVDEIYLYNDSGEIIYSTVDEYIGWTAQEGHPVYDFMVSEQKTRVEEIRPDSESGVYYKFGYVQAEDNQFVQIGILAEQVRSFLDNFEINSLINTIANSGDVKYVFYINPDYEIVASNLTSYVGTKIQRADMRERIADENPQVIREKINDFDALQVIVPVLSNGQRIGTLAIAWPADTLYATVKSIIANSVVVYLIVILIVGSILFYAFMKNRANVKIAYYDKLTGLPNSEYLEDQLKKTINNLGNRKAAVLLLNCTNFKTLNMTYGFAYGNQILKQITNKLQQKIVNSKDMLFRFSADRFVLLVDEYKERTEIDQLAENVVNIFDEPFDGEAEHQFINAEVAIVEIQQDNMTVDKLLQDASLALNPAFRQSKKPITYFYDNMEQALKRKEKIERALRAVINDEMSESFYLEFQPKLDIKTNRINGFEALARLKLPDLGNVSPFEFIAIAEEKLLIYDLGNQIINRACQFVAKLREQGHQGVGIAINISGIQLMRDEFIEVIKDKIKLSNNNAISLEFEITESILLDNFDLINDKLNEIRGMGILVSLDDFGTGFSSFFRLRELNIDSVKIDKYFIDKILLMKEDDLITADIISMSHKIGLTVVAEGVEEKAQLDYLRKHDCDIIQGYFISKPLPSEKALEFLANFGKV